jgi:hypothetical protein
MDILMGTVSVYRAKQRATPFFGALNMKLSRVYAILLGLLMIAPVPDARAQSEKASTKKSAWRSLFDGRTLDGWKSANYGGEGEVVAEQGTLVLNVGSSMTGVTYQRPFPKMDYEVRCEAKRAAGHDFFCGMTFPVAESHCSLIVGGWGGALVGLSSINGHDASENETTKYMKFEDNRWYKFRVRVRQNRIEAWIDDERVIDADITGCKISTRVEVDLNKPFGFASYETKAVLRNIEVRELRDVSAAELEREIAAEEAKRLQSELRQKQRKSP